MSRIVQFSRTGGPEVLEFEEVDVPLPAKEEVRIRAKALGLNRAESMWRRGEYIEDPILPARLGYEVAGVIDAVGANVTDVAVGDAVSVVPGFSQNQYGMYGELVLAPARAVVKHPSTLSYEEAASVWMMFVTAYGALVTQAELKAGEAVLISAASSSVSIAAIQVAKMLGAVPIALTRTDAKQAQLLQAGAAHVVVTEEQDIVSEVSRITDGKGVRVVFDPVGGPAFQKLMAVTSPGGLIMLYGALSPEPTTLNIFVLIAKKLTIQANTIWTTSSNPERLQRAKAFVVDGLAKGSLKPVIDRIFAFEDIIESHRYLETNQQFGKIVVTI